MTLKLRHGVIGACITLAALSIPTPALAAEAGGGAADSRAQAAGLCELMPLLWWCKK
jgi:hypothetical protein